MEILKVTINEGQGLKQTDPSTQRCLKSWSEGDEEDDEVSVVWEESVHSGEGRELVCWETEE